jgi:hypothetical protein
VAESVGQGHRVDLVWGDQAEVRAQRAQGGVQGARDVAEADAEGGACCLCAVTWSGGLRGDEARGEVWSGGAQYVAHRRDSPRGIGD